MHAYRQQGKNSCTVNAVCFMNKRVILVVNNMFQRGNANKEIFRKTLEQHLNNDSLDTIIKNKTLLLLNM